MFIMLDLFQQYTEAIYQSPVFTDAIGGEGEQNGNVNPTQTSAPDTSQYPSGMLGNRAERRKEKPGRNPLDIVNGKKLNNP